MWETRVPSLGQEDPLKKGMATHSSILTWRIPWTAEPGRLHSMALQRVRHDWATFTHSCKCITLLKLSRQYQRKPERGTGLPFLCTWSEFWKNCYTTRSGGWCSVNTKESVAIKDSLLYELKNTECNCVLLLLHGQWFHLSGLSPRERSW